MVFAQSSKALPALLCSKCSIGDFEQALVRPTITSIANIRMTCMSYTSGPLGMSLKMIADPSILRFPIHSSPCARVFAPEESAKAFWWRIGGSNPGFADYDRIQR
ncbi:MAG: hypothetical protein EBV49_13275 [Betaproteobacteria bacterium]|nr:hypothetical protein [Betaproteobacteria bacterium]